MIRERRPQRQAAQEPFEKEVPVSGSAAVPEEAEDPEQSPGEEEIGEDIVEEISLDDDIPEAGPVVASAEEEAEVADGKDEDDDDGFEDREI